MDPNEELALTQLMKRNESDPRSLTSEEIEELRQLLTKKWRITKPYLAPEKDFFAFTPDEELAFKELMEKNELDEFSLTLEERRQLKQLMMKKWKFLLNQAYEADRMEMEEIREHQGGNPMISEEAYGAPSNFDMVTPSQIFDQLNNLSV